MGRVLAFDFGKVRTGIAVTDELQIIASGLKTVLTKDIYPFIDSYLKNENIELFVVGEPKQMNNKLSESEQYIQPFLKKLKNKYPRIPIVRIDERFTSKLAVKTMIDSGLKKKHRQNKALVDEISATIILQTYLDQK